MTSKHNHKITLSNGSEYVGELRDGVLHGQGTWTGIDGDKYEGEFKDGKRNGQGTWTGIDGSKFEGEWKDGIRNGQGTFTFSSGKRYEGVWKHGNADGFLLMTFLDRFWNINHKIIDWIGVKNEGFRRIITASFLVPVLFCVLLAPDVDLLILAIFPIAMFGWFLSLLIVVRLSKWIKEGFKQE